MKGITGLLELKEDKLININGSINIENCGGGGTYSAPPGDVGFLDAASTAYSSSDNDKSSSIPDPDLLSL